MCANSILTTDSVVEELSPRSVLASCYGPLSSPRKNSEFSRIYKQASHFFLTRRLPEALATILPLVTIAPREHSVEVQNDEYDTTLAQAPIAKANQKWRVKFWSFYLTLINTIANLGVEDGVSTFGHGEWRRILAIAQNGTVWDEVVQSGYGGVEENVDDDVVINLATLLLKQSPTQTSNQRHLESYLAVSSSLELSNTREVKCQDCSDEPADYHRLHSKRTVTTRDLETRIQLLEIYALQVLPRNGEWQYAKDYINLSEILDDERREGCLSTLNDLREDAEYKDGFKHALSPQELEAVHKSESTDSVATETIKARAPALQQRLDGEEDYGIENAKPLIKRSVARPSFTKPIRKPSCSIQSNPKPPSARKPPERSQTSVFKRSVALVAGFQHLLKSIAQQVSHNPTSLLRFVLFLLGIVAALSRRDMKDRITRLTGSGWEKVKTTVGMGVKVSYI